MKRNRESSNLSATAQLKAFRAEAEEIVRKVPRQPATAPVALAPDRIQAMLHDLQVHQIELELQNLELREAQHALEISRARYFDLYDLAPVGYFMLNDNGVIVEANLTGAKQLGVARGQLIKRAFSRFVASADADRYYVYCKQLFKTGVPQAFELRLQGANDADFPAWIEASMVPPGGSEPVCRFVVSDITKLKTALEDLQLSQRLVKAAGKVAQVGGWSIKLPNNEVMWSAELLAILDFPAGASPSMAEALALYPPASRKIISRALESCIRDGLPFDHEVESFTANRRSIHARAIGHAVRDEAGNINSVEGAFQDITQRKMAAQAHASLESQLRESQKMEAIGTLAGGIAHDFNNILGTILGNAELARQDCGANWQALMSLEEIQKAANRARDLVQQILSFSRRQPTSRRLMSLASVVEEAVRLLRAALPGGARIDCYCAVDMPPVLADSTQIQQVLLNLGTNAAHAMEGRLGTIDFRAEGITLDAESARFEASLRPGRYARIAVSDAGAGMDAATQRRVFEPFFTTKPAGKGTGLGLSVAQGIMQGHGGVIVVHSELGKGSRFELYFPSAGAAADAPVSTEEVPATSEGRGQHVVYIDDDEAQLFLFKRMLERWGYRVSAFLEQREALALLAGEEPVDIVVTDFNMPGISGVEVARAIRDARPNLPVVVVSGYITDALRSAAVAAGVRELIAKPHEIEDLRDALQRLTAAPAVLGREQG